MWTAGTLFHPVHSHSRPVDLSDAIPCPSLLEKCRKIAITISGFPSERRYSGVSAGTAGGDVFHSLIVGLSFAIFQGNLSMGKSSIAEETRRQPKGVTSPYVHLATMEKVAAIPLCRITFKNRSAVPGVTSLRPPFPASPDRGPSAFSPPAFLPLPHRTAICRPSSCRS